MKIRRFQSIRILLAVGVTLLVAGTLIAYIYAQQGWTPRKVQRTVSERLPDGSANYSIVIAIQELRWAYKYDDSCVSISYYCNQMGLPARGVKSIIYAEVPNPNVGLFDSGTITVFFFLDHDGKLINSYVRVAIVSM